MKQSYMEKKQNKPKVLMYYTFSDKIGGPLTYLNTIINSELNEEFEFKTLFQEKAPGGWDWKLLKDMTNAIKEEKPDILHIHGVQSEGFYGVLAGKLAGCKKILMTVHGFAFDDSAYNGIKKFLYKNFVEPWSMKRADGVYCVCDCTAQRDIVLKNVKKSKNFGYIHNPAPKNFVPKTNSEDIRKSLSVTDDEVLFCIASRLSREKGYDILTQIVKKTIKITNGKFKLLVLGDGDYKEEFEKNLSAEINQKSVLMVGSTNRVADYLFASDGFVFPSYHENLSIALLEAGLAGLPAVVSCVGGNPEVIENNVNGYAICGFSPDDYVEKLVYLTENTCERKRMGKNAQTIVNDKFLLHNICNKIKNVYENLLKQNNTETL